MMKTIPVWIRWLGAAAWTITTLVLMLSPSVSLPTTFLGDLTDKAAHFGTFFLLAVLWYSVLIGYILPARAFRVTCAIVLIFGAFTELAQGVVPGRTTDILDFTANALGIGAGATGAYWTQRWYIRRSSVPDQPAPVSRKDPV